MDIRPFIFFLIATAGCISSPDETKEDEVPKTVVANDTIPAERLKVSSDPVATYSVNVPDELNKFEFSVRLYETPLRFRYHVAVKYKMMEVKDSVDIPNFGHQPKVDLRKNHDDLSCMIGFYDTKGDFKDLKKVDAVDNQIKIVQVRRYALGTVRKTNE